MLIYSAYQQYGVIILWLDWYYLEELPLYYDTLTAKKVFFHCEQETPLPRRKEGGSGSVHGQAVQEEALNCCCSAMPDFHQQMLCSMCVLEL